MKPITEEEQAKLDKEKKDREERIRKNRIREDKRIAGRTTVKNKGYSSKDVNFNHDMSKGPNIRGVNYISSPDKPEPFVSERPHFATFKTDSTGAGYAPYSIRRAETIDPWVGKIYADGLIPNSYARLNPVSEQDLFFGESKPLFRWVNPATMFLREKEKTRSKGEQALEQALMARTKNAKDVNELAETQRALDLVKGDGYVYKSRNGESSLADKDRAAAIIEGIQAKPNYNSAIDSYSYMANAPKFNADKHLMSSDIDTENIPKYMLKDPNSSLADAIKVGTGTFADVNENGDINGKIFSPMYNKYVAPTYINQNTIGQNGIIDSLGVGNADKVQEYLGADSKTVYPKPKEIDNDVISSNYGKVKMNPLITKQTGDSIPFNDSFIKTGPYVNSFKFSDDGQMLLALNHDMLGSNIFSNKRLTPSRNYESQAIDPDSIVQYGQKLYHNPYANQLFTIKVNGKPVLVPMNRPSDAPAYEGGPAAHKPSTMRGVFSGAAADEAIDRLAKFYIYNPLNQIHPDFDFGTGVDYMQNYGLKHIVPAIEKQISESLGENVKLDPNGEFARGEGIKYISSTGNGPHIYIGEDGVQRWGILPQSGSGFSYSGNEMSAVNQPEAMGGSSDESNVSGRTQTGNAKIGGQPPKQLGHKGDDSVVVYFDEPSGKTKENILRDPININGEGKPVGDFERDANGRIIYEDGKPKPKMKQVGEHKWVRVPQYLPRNLQHVKTVKHIVHGNLSENIAEGLAETGVQRITKKDKKDIAARDALYYPNDAKENAEIQDEASLRYKALKYKLMHSKLTPKEQAEFDEILKKIELRGVNSFGDDKEMFRRGTPPDKAFKGNFDKYGNVISTDDVDKETKTRRWLEDNLEEARINGRRIEVKKDSETGEKHEVFVPIGKQNPEDVEEKYQAIDNFIRKMQAKLINLDLKKNPLKTNDYRPYMHDYILQLQSQYDVNPNAKNKSEVLIHKKTGEYAPSYILDALFPETREQHKAAEQKRRREYTEATRANRKYTLKNPDGTDYLEKGPDGKERTVTVDNLIFEADENGNPKKDVTLQRYLEKKAKLAEADKETQKIEEMKILKNILQQEFDLNPIFKDKKDMYISNRTGKYATEDEVKILNYKEPDLSAKTKLEEDAQTVALRKAGFSDEEIKEMKDDVKKSNEKIRKELKANQPQKEVANPMDATYTAELVKRGYPKKIAEDIVKEFRTLTSFNDEQSNAYKIPDFSAKRGEMIAKGQDPVPKSKYQENFKKNYELKDGVIVNKETGIEAPFVVQQIMNWTPAEAVLKKPKAEKKKTSEEEVKKETPKDPNKPEYVSQAYERDPNAAPVYESYEYNPKDGSYITKKTGRKETDPRAIAELEKIRSTNPELIQNVPEANSYQVYYNPDKNGFILKNSRGETVKEIRDVNAIREINNILSEVKIESEPTTEAGKANLERFKQRASVKKGTKKAGGKTLKSVAWPLIVMEGIPYLYEKYKNMEDAKKNANDGGASGGGGNFNDESDKYTSYGEQEDSNFSDALMEMFKTIKALNN